MKPFAFAELLARVRTLLRRGAAVIIESQFQVADLMVDLVSRKVTRSGTRITLTSKEFTLLEFSSAIKAKCCPLAYRLAGVGHEFRQRYQRH